MKNISTLFLFFCICSPFAAKSQAVYIPNGEMENWVDDGPFDEPQNWSTFNPYASLVTDTAVVFKDPDAYSGNFAARLVAISDSAGVIPGIMSTGTLDMATLTFKPGVLVLGDLTGFGGFYKYFPQGNDTCLFLAIGTKWNTITSHRDTVAIAAFISGSQPTYAEFNVPFVVLKPDEFYDSATVIVSTSRSISTAHSGSILYADQMDFSDLLSVNDPKPANAEILPDPADKTLLISLPQNIKAQDVLIINTSGTEVRQIHSTTSSQININTSTLKNGLYAMYAKNSKGKIVAVGKFMVEH